jgi:histidyl-tRNA synthetase
VLGGGRYDGLMESLGGAPTPAVGWAAGIERLAMVVGAREEAKADAVVVVENDDRLADAITLMGKLRASGFSAELVASGSPRKRFDKAKKLPSHALVSFAVTDNASPMRIMGDGGERHTAVENFILTGQ